MKIKIHFCKEHPCPLQDKECADRLNNGFTVNYISLTPQQVISEAGEEKSLIGKNVHSVYTHCLSCHTWDVNMPLNKVCGNCNKDTDTITYYDIETILSWHTSTLQAFLEAEIALLESKKRKIELSEPRLYQSNPTLNEMGGYSSVPFYCSLCQMNEMDIQDNKLGVLENDPIHYACHCSVWDSPTGGKWVRWYDKEKAEQILRELPSEDNAYNQAISDQITHLKELLKKEGNETKGNIKL